MAPPSKSNISPQASPSLAANLPIQAAPKDTAPAKSKNETPPLPAPISTSDIAQPKPSSGNWIIYLASVSNPKSADQEVTRLGKMDIKAEVSRFESKGKVWYRIQVPGYASRDEAINARPALEEKLGTSGTWVGQRK
jgi:cell division septation protein DedD